MAPPLRPVFFHAPPPLNPTSPPYLIKNERSLRLFLIKVSVRSYSARWWSVPGRGSGTYRARSVNLHEIVSLVINLQKPRQLKDGRSFPFCSLLSVVMFVNRPKSSDFYLPIKINTTTVRQLLRKPELFLIISSATVLQVH